jgi:hypothetical protein
MADAISAIASVQLGVLQSPEVAREHVPIAMQAQIANAQAAAVIAKHQQEALETVARLQEVEGHGVGDALDASPERGSGYPRRRGRQRPPVQHKAEAVAASHPRGVGALVDVRA